MIKLEVTQLMDYIKNITSKDFVLSNLAVEGEISNYTHHSNGNIYFNIKDETSRLDCIMFRNEVDELEESFKIGDQVIVSGRVDFREEDGTIRLISNKIEQYGLGKLFANFEKLKKELYESGYFDVEHKKPIPKYPKKVGIVTSPTGAAIRDILTVAKQNNPYIDIILYPAVVQGPFSSEAVIRGLKYFEDTDVDVVIIGRGGGAYEDLDGFNSRNLAMAIFEHPLPIVSAVGHEVDFLISDYISDMRAATPTDAANKIFFNHDEYLKTIKDMINSIKSSTYSVIDENDIRIKTINNRIKATSIDRIIDQRLNTYKDNILKLNNNIKATYEINAQKLQTYKLKLSPNKYIYTIDAELNKIKNLKAQIEQTVLKKIEYQQSNLQDIEHGIKKLDVYGTIEDGFSLLLDKDQRVLKDIDDISVGDQLELLVNGGKLLVSVLEKEVKNEL